MNDCQYVDSFLTYHNNYTNKKINSLKSITQLNRKESFIITVKNCVYNAESINKLRRFNRDNPFFD